MEGPPSGRCGRHVEAAVEGAACRWALGSWRASARGRQRVEVCLASAGAPRCAHPASMSLLRLPTPHLQACRWGPAPEPAAAGAAAAAGGAAAGGAAAARAAVAAPAGGAAAGGAAARGSGATLARARRHGALIPCAVRCTGWARVAAEGVWARLQERSAAVVWVCRQQAVATGSRLVSPVAPAALPCPPAAVADMEVATGEGGAAAGGVIAPIAVQADEPAHTKRKIAEFLNHHSGVAPVHARVLSFVGVSAAARGCVLWAPALLSGAQTACREQLASGADVCGPPLLVPGDACLCFLSAPLVLPLLCPHPHLPSPLVHRPPPAAYELIPESGKVVLLDADLPMRQAFHALHEQGALQSGGGGGGGGGAVAGQGRVERRGCCASPPACAASPPRPPACSPALPLRRPPPAPSPAPPAPSPPSSASSPAACTNSPLPRPGIASAPLWDGEQGRVMGMLSASDFIHMLQVTLRCAARCSACAVRAAPRRCRATPRCARHAMPALCRVAMHALRGCGTPGGWGWGARAAAAAGELVAHGGWRVAALLSALRCRHPSAAPSCALPCSPAAPALGCQQRREPHERSRNGPAHDSVGGEGCWGGRGPAWGSQRGGCRAGAGEGSNVQLQLGGLCEPGQPKQRRQLPAATCGLSGPSNAARSPGTTAVRSAARWAATGFAPCMARKDPLARRACGCG